MKQVRDAALDGGFGEALPRAVAINYAKLLAYKDEYEVARLYTDGRFEQQTSRPVRGDFKISFNLAPPLLGGGKDALGRPKKRAFGPWMMPAFRLLAKMRGLRGTPFDIFGYSADRRLERDLIAGYEKDVATVLSVLSPLTLDTAVELLSLPDRIRGFGPVKEKSVQDAKARYAQLAQGPRRIRRPRRARSRRSNRAKLRISAGAGQLPLGARILIAGAGSGRGRLALREGEIATVPITVRVCDTPGIVHGIRGAGHFPAAAAAHLRAPATGQS